MGLSIEKGYYFLVDRKDSMKYMHVDIGKGFQNDDIQEVTILEENGFIVFKMNNTVTQKRDLNVTKKAFEDVANTFIDEIVSEYSESAVCKLDDNGNFIPYFEKE